MRLLLLSLLPEAFLAEPEDTRVNEGVEDVADPDELTSQHVVFIHKKLDRNKDGKASLKEVLLFTQEVRLEMARRDVHDVLLDMDEDSNGKLSADELLKDSAFWSASNYDEKKELHERWAVEGAKFAAADTGGDGFLDNNELALYFFPDTKDAVLDVIAKQELENKDSNSDGELTLQEFWASDHQYYDTPFSDKEKAEFAGLDSNHNGKIGLEELKLWESGQFHTEQALKRLIDICDKDEDVQFTVEEFVDARSRIADSEAMYHVMEWVEYFDL